MTRTTQTAGALLLAVLVAGCANDPKSKMRRYVREYNDAANLLATVKDKASFEAARPKLTTHIAWLREQQREAAAQAKGKQATDKDFQAAMKEFEKLEKEPEFKQLMDASTRYGTEMMRAQIAVPEFAKFYRDEMAKP